LTPDGLLHDLDREKLESIRVRQGVYDPTVHADKYLVDVEKWLGTNIQRVLNLGLDLENGKRVLDLGSGPGYFLYICKRLGHDVLGLDILDPGFEWYADMFELFGMPKRVIWRIDPFVPLPDLGPPFDYVSAFMVCFNRHLEENAWKIEEWRFFLDDLWTHLKPGAVVWFQLNPGPNGAPYSPELQSYFESRGAIVDGKHVVWGMDKLQYRLLLKLARQEIAAIRPETKFSAKAT
jgi:cyclopropane fatty-acyl-phospholipid synthase-like methyltransferase